MLPLCFLAVLVVHELGHYLSARILDLQVEHVIFGRGKLLFSRTDKRGTQWKLHVLPFGAHVQIADFESSSLPVRQKLFVVFAGPVANFLLPVVLFFLFFLTFGQPSIPPIATAVEPGMPAYKAGMRPGDHILFVNGDEVRGSNDVIGYTAVRQEKPLDITYRRGTDIKTASVLPVWMTYRDLDGVARAHGRIGLNMWAQAYHLKAVRSVAGESVASLEEARAALLDHMGQQVEVGLWSSDGKIYYWLIDLSAKSNLHLADTGHKESRRLYLGAMRDNLYLPLTLSESLREALNHAGEMTIHVALLPFNMFPVDHEWLTPDAVVTNEASPVGARLYTFIFFTSLCSVFMAFLNLLPFPRLDGGAALLIMGEAWKRRPLVNKEKAAILVFSLLFFYAAVFGANVNNMRGYYLFQIQKAQAATAGNQ